MHLADALSKATYIAFKLQVFTFYQLLLSLGIEPMILASLVSCSTIWATGKLHDCIKKSDIFASDFSVLVTVNFSWSAVTLWIKSDQNEIQQISTHLERSSWIPSQFCFTGCNSLDFWVSSVWLWITGSRPSINHPPLFWSMEPCVHGTLQLVVTSEITLVSYSHSKNRGRTFWLLALYKRKGFY